MTTDRSTTHAGRKGTVGGGGNCAADTEVSTNFDVGRNEMTVVPGKVVVGHNGAQREAKQRQSQKRSLNEQILEVYHEVMFKHQNLKNILTMNQTFGQIPEQNLIGPTRRLLTDRLT